MSPAMPGKPPIGTPFELPVAKSKHGSLTGACHSRASSSGTAGSIRGKYGHTDLLVYLGKDA